MEQTFKYHIKQSIIVQKNKLGGISSQSAAYIPPSNKTNKTIKFNEEITALYNVPTSSDQRLSDKVNFDSLALV